MSIILIIVAAVLLSPVFVIFNSGEGTLAGNLLTVIIYFFLILYSLLVRRKRHAIIKRCYSVLGIIFFCYLFFPILLPTHRGPDYIRIRRQVVTTNLSAIYDIQKEYFDKHHEYAKNFKEIRSEVLKRNLYNFNYQYSINNEEILKNFNIERSKNGFVAIAKADKFERGWSYPTYYCQDIWVIGDQIPLTNIKKGFPCDAESFMTIKEIVRFCILALIITIMIVERITYFKKKKTISNQWS